MSYIDSDRLRQVTFLTLIILLGILLFWRSYGFLPGFLGALTLYILLRPLLFYLVHIRKWKRIISATLLMIGSFIIILMPIGLLVNLLSSRAGYIVSHSTELITSIKQFADRIRLSSGMDILSDANIQKIQGTLANFLPQFLGATFSTLTSLLFMYFILYFMLVSGKSMEASVVEFIPLKNENIGRLGKEVKGMVISNAVGIPLLAILQGIFSYIGYSIFGVGDPLFWGVVTAFMSILPVVGTASIWIPICIYLLAIGQTWHGVGLIIYSLVVIVNLDNVFRLILQKKMMDVHPMITIFGVIIGVELFGFVGLIFGPLLISIFILMLRIYRDEFMVRNRDIEIIRK
ncbi:MAG TPA: AI-2E family transporter [Chitinophagaceae bacterium]|nr:AI-2E family transporter [Chitinophagaceae bacterium]